MLLKNVFGADTEGHVISAVVAAAVISASPAIGTRGAAGVDVLSDPVKFHQYDTLSAQLIATGTVDGAWAIEWSNNYEPGGASGGRGPARAGNWVAETTATLAAPGGDGQNDLVEIQWRAAKWVRFRFTPSAGAGNVDIWISLKGT